MGARHDQTTEQKLDMALDDLVSDDRGRDRDRRDDRRQAEERDRDRDEWRGNGGGYGAVRTPLDDLPGPYPGRDGKGRGKGKGRRRLPPEDKALLNTRVFFNEAGEFVVRLHDTEVVILRQQRKAKPPADADMRPPGAAAAEAPGCPEALAAAQPQAGPEAVAADTPAPAPEGERQPPAPTGAEGAASQVAAAARPGEAAGAEASAPAPAGAEAALAEPGRGAAAEAACASRGPGPQPAPAEQRLAASPEGKPAADAEKQPAMGALVVQLTSGRFRTAETKYILNEALHALCLRVSEGGEPSTAWTVLGEGISRAFEDGMQVTLEKPLAEPDAVKQHLEGKIEAAKARDENRPDAGPQRHSHSRGDYLDCPPHGRGPPLPLHQQRPDWPVGPPLPPGWFPPHGPPPPGHRGPPPGWRGPPFPPHGWGPPPWDMGPHHRPQMPPYGGPPGPPMGRHPPPVPREPLPDSYFQ